jgi:hypothetical protein
MCCERVQVPFSGAEISYKKVYEEARKLLPIDRRVILLRDSGQGDEGCCCVREGRALGIIACDCHATRVLPCGSSRVAVLGRCLAHCRT